MPKELNFDGDYVDDEDISGYDDNPPVDFWQRLRDIQYPSSQELMDELHEQYDYLLDEETPGE